jgi:hypothetical protein
MATTLFGLPKLMNVKMPAFMTNLTPVSTQVSNTNEPTWIVTKESALQYVGYLVAIVIVLLAILLFVHFLITPIFQFTPGGPGVIPIPGTNDATVYWKTYPIDPELKNTVLGSQSANWSMTLDILIEEPFVPPPASKQTRVFLERSMGTQADSYNLRFALVSNTTDLRISTLNSSNSEEYIDITNTPVQTPFRVGVVLLDRVMEVYVNGRLYKTLTLSDPVKSEGGGFKGPQGDMATMAKVKNLILWKRPITPSEMRYARPSLASASEFNPTQMKAGVSGICN